MSAQKRFLSPSPYRPMTVLILIGTTLLFIFGAFQTKIPPKTPGVVEAPVLSKLNRALIFDYPLYFELRDQWLLQKQEDLFEKMQHTPFWNGAYERSVDAIVHSTPFFYSGKMFEKISQGEVWRIFTPALLHFNFLHILFNVLWFIILGNQIEYRIGALRYLLLIFVSAIFSNTAQYLMSGSFFMGLSGVVVAFVGFIFARQRKAPWEGYLLNKMTLIFLAAFVFGMFVLSLVFFLLQITGQYKGTIPIANTAHIVGGFTGYLLGNLKLFSIKKEVA